jgi:predicted MPP superfamily phosphohydrolase
MMFRQTSKRWGRVAAGAVLVVVAMLAAYGWCDAHYSLAVRHVSVGLDGLPPELEGLTILHITDLHGRYVGKDQKRLLSLIKEERFDLVAATGDFIDESRPDGRAALTLLGDLTQAAPVFFVPGNHEYWSGRGDTFRNELSAAGVTVLQNRRVYMADEGVNWYVAGVDDPYTGRAMVSETLGSPASPGPLIPAGTAPRNRSGEGENEPAFTLMLAHSPAAYAEAKSAGVSLLLAGHTHGGQVRIPGLGAIWVPGQAGLFPTYDSGLFREQGSAMYVSTGVGFGFPFRLFCSPEITLIALSGRQVGGR